MDHFVLIVYLTRLSFVSGFTSALFFPSLLGQMYQKTLIVLIPPGHGPRPPNPYLPLEACTDTADSYPTPFDPPKH